MIAKITFTGLQSKNTTATFGNISDILKISKNFFNQTIFYNTQWYRKPKNVQKFRITLFWHVAGLRDVNFTEM